MTKPSSLSLPRGRCLPTLPSSSPRFGKVGFARRSLPATPDSPSSRSVHAGCIIRVSIEGMEDRSSGGVIYRGIWVSRKKAEILVQTQSNILVLECLFFNFGVRWKFNSGMFLCSPHSRSLLSVILRTVTDAFLSFLFFIFSGLRYELEC